MKPPKFEYEAPTTIEEAISLLEEYGSQAKILAGGQSLIAALNFRSVKPDVVIDINKINMLEYVKKSDSGDILIGALSRQGKLEHDPIIEKDLPLMYYAIPFVAHTAIRNRGTIGGSIVYADPAGEQPTITMTLGASYKLLSSKRERWVSSEDFFLAMNKTMIKPDELLTEIKIPAMDSKTGWAFEEVSRRHGDRVMMGVAALVKLDSQGICKDVLLVYQNGAVVPVPGKRAAQLFTGEKLKDVYPIIPEAAEIASLEDIDPVGDVHTSPDFQRNLARELTVRVLTKAFKDAEMKLG